MFTAFTLSLALFTSSIVALPLSAPEPSIVTKMAIYTGLPFDIASPIPSANMLARSGEWVPAEPAWSAPATPAWTADPPLWTPSPSPWSPTAQDTWAATPTPSNSPTPSPSTTMPASSTPTYPWEETHNDSKTTRANGIIAGTVFGGFFALIILVYALCMTYHRVIKPYYRGKRGADEEAGKTMSIASTDAGGIQMVENDGARPGDEGFRVVQTTGGVNRL